MSNIIMVTGGARSGKSGFAENKVKDLAKEHGQCHVIYLATATSCDDEMADRIAKHRAARPAEWITVEKFRDFQEFDTIIDQHNAQVIILDCLGFMLNNIMFYGDIDFNQIDSLDFEAIEKSALLEINALTEIARKKEVDLVVVTNEVGMALVPPDKISRYYRDILGRLNSNMAMLSDEVYFTVSGIPMKIK